MLAYRGVTVEHLVMQIRCEVRNPYDAVEQVFLNSNRPLKDEDRIEFIAENLVELDKLCHEMHEDWKENHERDAVPIKRPTHTAPATLQ